MCKNMWPRWWRSKKEKRQPAMNDSCAGEIVVQLRQWEGEYWSKDIPGGTTQAPHTDSFFLVNAAETSVRQLRIPIADPVYPLFSSDGQWLYFQSNASGHWQIYRCRPDGAQPQSLTAKHKLGIDSFGPVLAR